MGLFSKIGEGLRKTRGSLMNSVNSMLKAFGKVYDELFEELEEILIAGDVGINTASRICEELRRRAKEQKSPTDGRNRSRFLRCPLQKMPQLHCTRSQHDRKRHEKG